ncbi:hypothetical protein NE235_03940 [Actinoallomurus spadix]|uniref:Uncharacterized protein n=1 Tax=Actinoallomurus spadix TaxID=79912 RepID=A0ABN0XN69_9ACTN|nr:hypothetical protein [Actinoallomurus spadix]MCO5985256.1 hypothetical protein [Actinoallomurus spadix]
MTGSPPTGPVTPASVDARTAQLTGRLADALTARGLRARVAQGARVLASNPAGEPPDDDHHAKILSPGLRQTVVCGADRDGRLLWFWQWSGPTRESPPEYEPLCAADEISHAADRIAGVLRVVEGR